MAPARSPLLAPPPTPHPPSPFPCNPLGYAQPASLLQARRRVVVDEPHGDVHNDHSVLGGARQPPHTQMRAQTHTRARTCTHTREALGVVPGRRDGRRCVAAREVAGGGPGGSGRRAAAQRITGLAVASATACRIMAAACMQAGRVHELQVHQWDLPGSSPGFLPPPRASPRNAGMPCLLLPPPRPTCGQ